MRLDRDGISFEDGTGFYWPFPRLRFRLRNGYWCDHTKPLDGAQTYVAPGDEWCLSRPTEPAWEPSSQGRPDGWVRIDYQTGRMTRRCSVCTYAEFK